MKAVAEIAVQSIGDESQRRAVASAIRILEDRGLRTRAHAMGTDVEGSLEDVLGAVQAVHEGLHAAGLARIETTLKIETRTDKLPQLAARDRAAHA
jgi:uncharacterized protein (TIGR00106 family)